MGTSRWDLKSYSRTMVFIMKEKICVRNKYELQAPPETEYEYVSGGVLSL